jgi:hypothetical protein
MLNQCRNYCQFGHFARACTVSKVQIWDGSTLAGKLPTWNEKVGRRSDSMPPSKTISTIKNVGSNHEIGSKNLKKIADANISIAKVGASHVLRPLSENPTTKNIKKNPTLEQWRQKAPNSNKED